MKNQKTAFKKTDDINIDNKYLYMVMDGSLEKGNMEDVLYENVDIFESAGADIIQSLKDYLEDIPKEDIPKNFFKEPKRSDFEILTNYQGHPLCIGVSTRKINVTADDLKALVSSGNDRDGSDNEMKIACDLLKIAKSLVAGEKATKDGKYGTKQKGWSGTIDYNGTKGTVTNAVFELKNGRITWSDGTWEEGTWAYGLWKNGLWKTGIWQVGEWLDGIWEEGTWEYGTWQTGIWKNGTWKNGTWKNGVWEKGVHENGWWENGVWKYGAWNDGTFWNGTWEDGTWNNGLNWYGIFSKGIWNNGQWNEGQWKGGKWNGGKDKKQVWHPEGASPDKWTVETK